MDIDFKKLAPWNWFKKEQEEQTASSALSVQRNDVPVPGGSVSSILQLHREIDRLFDDAFRGFGFPTLTVPRSPADWPGMLKPALDIQEDDKQYKIALELPGVEEKNIQINLDNDVLVVRGEKRQEQEKKEGGFHHIERSYGSFQRRSEEHTSELQSRPHLVCRLLLVKKKKLNTSSIFAILTTTLPSSISTLSTSHTTLRINSLNIPPIYHSPNHTLSHITLLYAMCSA